MLEFFAYKKFKKHQEDKKAEEEAAAARKDTGDKTNTTKPPKPGSSTLAAASPSKTGRELSMNAGDAAEVDKHAVLEDSDQAFIERILAEAEDEAPPLPRRLKTPDIAWESSSEVGGGIKTPATTVEGDSSDVEGKGKGKEKSTTEEKEKDKRKNRFSFLTVHLKKKPVAFQNENLEPVTPAITEKEANRETADLSSVLSKLNLSAGKGNKAISLSPDTTELVSKFTNVFKDLVNGVPTAYDDLMSLIEDHDGVLSRNYEKLPSSLKKLITTLPSKLTTTLAPELLAVAAEAQGLNAPGGPAGKDELKSAAMKFLTPANLAQTLTKPGALVSMLKGIVNALKARWPAFMGTNVVWAVAMSILMFVLWYCHKRGRETRLEREASEVSISATTGGGIKDGDRVEELPDDPALPGPEAKQEGIPGLSETRKKEDRVPATS
ncbi:hypothetical protein MKZ38_005980 [Zalerion maritima]|uniref:Ring-like domain-containing protein n=1 Tax=Zalerion maritima TaxID=339359 RepID=A0AAD5WQM2_9PEZI|nr:hypothetical protein MKZ38_005980 [Zalerion maritima]